MKLLTYKKRFNLHILGYEEIQSPRYLGLAKYCFKDKDFLNSLITKIVSA